MTKRAPKSDFDTAWKELPQRHFEAAIAFFFPAVHSEIDWRKRPSFHDKELQYAVRHAGRGKRTVDLLAKVRLKRGAQVWIFLLVEVQNQRDPDFEERLFGCNALLSIRHRQHVVSLGILGDTQRHWRPNRFARAACGCEIDFRFNVVKLLDYEDRVAELEQSSNLWAKVVLAHLKTLATRPDSETRLQWKKRVMHGLAEQGCSNDEIVDVFRFLDLVMTLPPDLEGEFQEYLDKLQEEQKMAFLSSYERKAMSKGRREGRVEGRLEASQSAVMGALQARFERTPAALQARIRQLDDPARLMGLLQIAVTANSLEEFEKQLPTVAQAA